MFRKFAPAAATLLVMGLLPAVAHAQLAITTSKPAANAVASKVTSVSMRFSKPVVPASVKAELIMTAMPGMANHPPMKMLATSAIGKDAQSLTMTLRRPLVPGTYKVTWTAAAKGGERMTGHFSFTAK